jgi:tRNA nucleotidyltransferase/poly(A) polymerase
MKIRELLSQIAQLAKSNGISEPFLVGGIPRDKILNSLETIQDIDLTTGDDSIHQLARLTAAAFRPAYPDLSFKMMADGHSQIQLGDIKLDFSSNYQTPGVAERLQQVGEEPSALMTEMMSRDFTCNTLLMTLDLNDIRDLTGMGVRDIRRKMLVTPLAPRITLGSDHKRVARIPYLAAKLGFDVEPAIIAWVRNNPSSLMEGVKPRYVSQKLSKAMQYDPQRTVGLLDKMGLWHEVPMTDELIPYASQYGRA